MTSHFDAEGMIYFLQYFIIAIFLISVFVKFYIIFTPYHEWELIKKNNNAAAISLGGATLGFTLPLVSAIYYTVSISEMLTWAAMTCAVQFLVFTALRSQARSIENGMTAPAIFLAFLSISVGLINAVCISH